jgi:anti-anti-sigma factor
MLKEESLNVQVESVGDIRVVRVKEDRLVFHTLGTLTEDISRLIESGTRKLLIDLSQVEYLDSASIGSLMDLYRRMSEQTGSLKLVGLQERVERMVSLVGMHTLIDIFREEKTALESF